MFGWFKSKPQVTQPPPCEHNYKTIQLVYTDVRTDYHNGHDTVSAYRLMKCTSCNELFAEDVISKSFAVYRPEWPYDREAFIEKLEDKGFVSNEDYLINRTLKEVRKT